MLPMAGSRPDPDWNRLGARFGEPDVCVVFQGPGVVRRPDGEPLAEDAVALRESAGGVSVQVACGIFLTLPGARLRGVVGEGREAVVETPADVAPRRVPVRERPDRV